MQLLGVGWERLGIDFNQFSEMFFQVALNQKIMNHKRCNKITGENLEVHSETKTWLKPI